MGTLTLPSYGTTLDIGFNNELRNVIELSREGSPYTSVYILWDSLNTPDQQKLLNIIAQYGSPAIGILDTGGSPSGAVNPTPVAGWHTVNFSNLTLGGGSPLGGPGSPRDLTGSPLWTGLANDESTYSVTLVYTGSPITTSTTATANITGSDAQSFSTLATQLSTAFTGITVTYNNGNLKFQTDTTGAGTSVEIQPFGTLFNPASPLLGFDGFLVRRAGVDSRIDIFNFNRNNANVVFKDAFTLSRRGPKPVKATSNINESYFNGTIWVRLIDGKPVA